MAASEGYWRLPSSPIVRKNHKDFLCKLGVKYFSRKSVSKVFLRKSVSNEIGSTKTVKNFRTREKQDLIFKNSSLKRPFFVRGPFGKGAREETT